MWQAREQSWSWLMDCRDFSCLHARVKTTSCRRLCVWWLTIGWLSGSELWASIITTFSRNMRKWKMHEYWVGARQQNLLFEIIWTSPEVIELLLMFKFLFYTGMIWLWFLICGFKMLCSFSSTKKQSWSEAKHVVFYSLRCVLSLSAFKLTQWIWPEGCKLTTEAAIVHVMTVFHCILYGCRATHRVT